MGVRCVYGNGDMNGAQFAFIFLNTAARKQSGNVMFKKTEIPAQLKLILRWIFASQNKGY